MNRESYEQLTQDNINIIVQVIVPNGAGHITEHRLRAALEKISQQAFEAGRVYALMSLMSTEEAAAHYGISESRMTRIIAKRHERFGVGMKVGKRAWLVTSDELPALEPMNRGVRARK